MEIKELDVYQELSKRTMNTNPSLVNWILGLIGESAEVAEHTKKILFHSETPNIEAITKELGDVLWYLCAIATYFNIPMSKVMNLNLEKLQKRYPNGFSPEASLNRTE